MIAKVDGSNTVKVYKSDGTIVRHICCTRGPVSTAYVSGDEVNVQFRNGGAAIYKIDGRLVQYIN